MTEQELIDNLGDWRWRINNLYYITDKSGQKVLFQLNEQQLHFFENMHYRNIILKARQLGFTTFMMIFMLDACLFNDNTKCAVIAHTRDDATRLFREKIEFAYESLPESLRQMMPATIGRAGEYVFANASSISVGTSFRGGTLTYLHVSEFGKICARYPHKAKEIVTGAFEAVSQDCVITIESTAEGKSGYFFDYCKAAEIRQKKGMPTGRMDWELFFYPWHNNSDYTLDEDYEAPIRLIEYSQSLGKKYGIRLSSGQIAWYSKKEATLGADIKREYPSTPDEAFEQSVEGAYYKRQIDNIYAQGRLTSVPFETSALVHTFWDLGVSDMTCIWFIQQVGREYRVIDYYENSGEGLAFYRDILDKKAKKHGYSYGLHVAPHDISHRELGTGLSRIEQAATLGIKFEVADKLSIADGIEACRAVLPLCWFDERKTEKGFTGLQAYRKEWDDKYGVWKSKPCHDDASHPSDAFRTFAVALNSIKDSMGSLYNVAPTQVVVESSGGWA
jgi:hypothetical protein